MRTRAAGITIDSGAVTSVTASSETGQSETLPATHVFSSMPLRTLLQIMTPPPPPAALTAAAQLSYRDFLTVVLVIDNPVVFPDNWIYIHAPEVRMGRIQNFKSWSPEMVPDPTKSCLGLEYFVNEGDDVWSMKDDDLIQLGYSELQKIGLANGPLVKGYIVRMPKAYPVYDTGYQQRLDTIRSFVESIGNLYCVGRNGQHRYNNQDHSMATAIIAARNVALGEHRDPWAVNEDAEYHEIAKTERQAPITPSVLTSIPPEPAGAVAVRSHGQPVPALAMIGDPNAAATEHVLANGQKDLSIVVEDART